MATLLDRGRHLVAAGPYAAAPAEVAALHAALYPDREPVCQDCRGELGKAYYAIQRWVRQQDASSTNPLSSPVKKTTTARFHSDELQFTPHGLGITYSNANLTDKAARDILAADPDAARHFAVLPAEASAEEEAEDATQTTATTAVEQAQESAATPPAGFDYDKLASALADELERRHGAGTTPEPAAPVADAPALTASAGGAPADVTVTTGTMAPDSAADDHDDEKPVRLSRMGKEQLLATYRAELKLEPAEGLTNDELRQAIGEHRAAQQDPE